MLWNSGAPCGRNTRVKDVRVTTVLPNLLQCEWQEILQVSQKGQKKTQKFSFTWQNKWVGLLRKRHRWRQKKVKKINKKREKTRKEEKHKEGQKDSKAYRAGGREG